MPPLEPLGPPSGSATGSSTDLTRTCVPCRLRVRAARRVCPRCGGAELPASRAAAAAIAKELESLDLGPRARRLVQGSFWVFLLAVPAVGGWIGCETAPSGTGLIAGPLFAVIGIPLGAAAFALFEHVARRAARALGAGGGERRVDVEEPATADAADGARVVGRLLGPVAEPLRSPVRGDVCVAFRLVGRVGAFAIDDAVVVGFAIESESAERVRVGATELVLALEVGAPSVLDDAARERLRPFLEARGLPPAVGAPARLAEAVLRAGDRVEVTGAAVEVADPLGAGGGLREAPVVRGFVGTFDRPVVVRRG